MKPEQENFDQLRQLLTLKRYEQPPPRYFNDFSSQVINRIRAGEGRATWRDQLSWDAPWLQGLLSLFEAKPALAGAFGATACLLLLGGIVYSERIEPTQAVIWDAPGIAAAPAESATPFTGTPGFELSHPAEHAMLISSTNPIIAAQPGGSLFDLIRPQGQGKLASWPLQRN